MRKTDMRNLFAQRSDVKSEADVEALIVDRLIAKLRYPDKAVPEERIAGEFDGLAWSSEGAIPARLRASRSSRPSRGCA